jgi:hypothetical protein
MKTHDVHWLFAALGVATLGAAAATVAAAPPAPFVWSTVVNNGDFMPTDTCTPASPAPACRKFNSYNQPSVNADRLVVIRARSKGGQGGGQPVHGVYTRDMAAAGPVVKILDRNTLVPQPNNRDTVFVEPPSFPRIDIWSDTMATRGNHQPVWKVLDPDTGDILEQLGTTGIYTNPFGPLITGASKLGPVRDFSFFEVPEAPGTPFDVFPGAPAVTDGATIAFKGNYTVNLVGKTGVYYRDLENAPIPLDRASLEPAGGTNPVVLIANNTHTFIPGTSKVFGSTAPPSAANRQAVFAGFDNEENPTLGGIYLAPLAGAAPPLATLVAIGAQVPGESRHDTFNRLGEGVSFDGRFVAFWGAWGTATKTLVLQCREEGNADRVAFCKKQHPNGFTTTVPVNQGIFVHDLQTRQTRVVAKTPADFDDFVYWNFSGRTPDTGEGDDDGELARWRSASFVAVSGLVDGSLTNATFHAAFKARTGDVVGGAYVSPVDGIYLRPGPGQAKILTVVETGMDGTLIDPEAVFDDDEDPTTPPVPLPVTEMGLERDGFRGNSLAINVSMGTEEAGWAGIYLTGVPAR